jgi:predicted secreted protein
MIKLVQPSKVIVGSGARATIAGNRKHQEERSMRAHGLVGLSVLIVAALSAPALAQDAAGDQNESTRIVLSETAVREVEQDTLVAMLTARGEAEAPREAQNQVNQAIQGALEAASGAEDIRRSTGGYRVYQQRDREGQPIGWIAEQDIRMTSREPAPLLDLVGELQDAGLLLRGLSYELSREARKALEDELTDDALGRLRERAERVAGSLGAEVDRVAVLRLGGVDSPPPVMPRMMEMSARAEEAMAPPAALPDLETVSVRVEAEVLLRQ